MGYIVKHHTVAVPSSKWRNAIRMSISVWPMWGRRAGVSDADRQPRTVLKHERGDCGLLPAQRSGSLTYTAQQYAQEQAEGEYTIDRQDMEIRGCEVDNGLVAGYPGDPVEELWQAHDTGCVN